jgi:hypothetical protein
MLHSLRYSDAACVAATEIADPQLSEDASRFYNARAFRVDERCEGDLPVIAVAADAGGFSIDAPGMPTAFCDSRTDALVVLEHALTNALLDTCRGLAHVHAAGAVIQGKAVVALGGSGAGKSSLALAWTLAGHPSLGDDVVLLDETGGARPFERYFKVAPDVLRLLGVNPEATPFWDPSTQEAWYTPEDGPGWASPSAIGLVAICSRSSGSPLSILPGSPAEGLNALVHSRMGTGLDAARSFPLLHRVVTDAEVLHVQFESASEAATAIEERLR